MYITPLLPFALYPLRRKSMRKWFVRKEKTKYFRLAHITWKSTVPSFSRNLDIYDHI
jgi:hypothetical protein